jgi:hypothetical protein
VDGAIHLDRQPLGGTVEIDYKASDDLLPPKVQAELIAAEVLPESAFGGRRPRLEPARGLMLTRAYRLPSHYTPLTHAVPLVPARRPFGKATP